MTDRTAIREEARSFFDGVNPAHDWHHVERVYSLAERLAQSSGADVETVRLAALLHDIGRGKEDRGEIDDHASWGAEKAGEILSRHDTDGDMIEAVQHCVRSHRYSRPPEPETVEAKVLSDADNLDALGAVGIARVFCYSGSHGRPLHDPGLPVEEDDDPEGSTAVNHVRKKILQLSDRLYLDASRQMAERREEYVRTFLERFEREVDARI